jgi:hypothetical protein
VTDLGEKILRPLAEQKLSTYEIADRLGCTQNSVYRAMRRLGIKCQGRPGGAWAGSKDDRYVPGQLSPSARPIGMAAEDSAQWAEREPWPIGIRFDSLSFKPCTQRKPVMPESNSGCGNSSQMVLG